MDEAASLFLGQVRKLAHRITLLNEIFLELYQRDMNSENGISSLVNLHR
jgi:hypothetical protein